LNLDEAILTPLDCRLVHFVDDDDEFLNAETLCQMNVLTCLAFPIESGFEFTSSRADDETSKVGKTCSHDHVRHVVLMPRRIKHCILLRGRVKESTAHLDRLALGLFFLRVVHYIGEPPGVATLLFGLHLVVFDGALVYDAHLQHDVTTDGGLACINMPDEDDAAGLFGLVDFGNFVYIGLDFNFFDCLFFRFLDNFYWVLVADFLLCLFLCNLEISFLLLLDLLFLVVSLDSMCAKVANTTDAALIGIIVAIIFV
jgi:hypothetical protein